MKMEKLIQLYRVRILFTEEVKDAGLYLMYTLEELSELGARGASQFHTNFTRLYRVGILRIAAFMFLYAATYTLQLCIVYKAVFCCCLVVFFFCNCKLMYHF